MTFNITTAFGQHSGSSMLKAAQNIATQAMNGSPVKNGDGSVAKDDTGQAYVDTNKARHNISKQQGDLQQRIVRNLKGALSTSGAEDIREDISNLRKLEVAQVCVDIACADDTNSSHRLNSQLRNAMNGTNPHNPAQHAVSRVLETALNGKLEPKEQPKDQFTVKGHVRA